MKFLDILTFMNPLAPVFESRHAPFSHVLRTTLWHKIYTAYEFFWGFHSKNLVQKRNVDPSYHINKNSSNRGKFFPHHLGLFDYLFLAFPMIVAYLNHRMLNALDGSLPLFPSLLLALGLFVVNLLALPLRLTAMALTFALLPIIIGVHFFAWLAKGRKVNGIALNQNVVINNNMSVSLRILLRDEKCSLDDLIIEKSINAREFLIYRYDDGWLFSDYHDKRNIGKFNLNNQRIENALIELNAGDIANEFVAAGFSFN